jgi:ubiquinone/menaquinone biosynthesis C-methylase UbiE
LGRARRPASTFEHLLPPECGTIPITDSDVDAKEWLAGVFDRAAPTYDEVAGAYHDHFGTRLVELAGVAAGDAVLDVACGRGAVLVPAAAKVGPSGRAVGVDLSAEMVRRARARVDAAGVAAELHVMDAENLDVRDGSFSVVLCGFGIFFLPDPEHALAGFRRSLAAGGTVGLSTWGAEDERWSWEDDLLADVVVERRAVSRPFDRAADLDELLRGAGFDDVVVETEHHGSTGSVETPPRGLPRCVSRAGSRCAWRRSSLAAVASKRVPCSEAPNRRVVWSRSHHARTMHL